MYSTESSLFIGILNWLLRSKTLARIKITSQFPRNFGNLLNPRIYFSWLSSGRAMQASLSTKKNRKSNKKMNKKRNKKNDLNVAVHVKNGSNFPNMRIVIFHSLLVLLKSSILHPDSILDLFQLKKTSLKNLRDYKKYIYTHTYTYIRYYVLSFLTVHQ